MTKSNTNSKKGFTIIEVVLVLAIAGLIFLMVFVALPALQRSQRDTQRRDDMARLITAVQNYQANHKNRSPFQGDTQDPNFVDQYLTLNNDSFDDPSTGETYGFGPIVDCNNRQHVNDDGKALCDVVSGTASDTQGTITPYKNATCDGSEPVPSRGANKNAFTIKLEGSGIYCTNN